MSEAANEIRMFIEEDGTVTVKTQGFSSEEHLKADQLIKRTFQDLGGVAKRVGDNKPKNTHSHTHIHSPAQQENKT